MYIVHPYFSLKSLGKKVCIIHGKIQYFNTTWEAGRQMTMEVDKCDQDLVKLVLGTWGVIVPCCPCVRLEFSILKCSQFIEAARIVTQGVLSYWFL